MENQRTLDQMQQYDGPLVEIDSVNTIFSDSSVVRVRMFGPKQLEFENGDRDFPKGVRVEFFGERGDSSSVLTANHAHYFKDQHMYKVTGNVIIRSIGESKTMKTEELFWKPGSKRVYTEKSLTITTPDKILLGEGLDASEDFTYYRILKPTGSILLNQ
ncbi:MAG: LPS export ABC transporter periplasmic protein LptC [Cytophagaceae bacterium]|jgi:LPS export ABC transporter protein LptC|nr:LPS export ABC transporter periplasmic protein LptC [Cytophagaceae bacterium]